ncbi:unnamed protein product [Penicillium pancosmium]
MSRSKETDDESFDEKGLGPSQQGPNGDGGVVDSKIHGQYYMSGPKLAMLIGGLCLSLFLLGLDTAIVSTAIPKITERFNSTNDIGWYGAAYFLAL